MVEISYDNEGGSNVSTTPEAESSQLAHNEAEGFQDVSPEADGAQTESWEDAPDPEPDESPLPVALPVLFENIPADLAALKRWALWCYERDEESGAVFRAHYSPDGSPAEPTEHWTWSTLRAVRAAYESGGYDGVSLAIGGDGLVLDDSILVGVRLSRQRTQYEDGSWSAWPGEALELVRHLDSYTEIHELGSGLHILVRAILPDALRTSRPARGTSIPHQFLIDFAHFLSVTGQPLDGVPQTIEDRTREMCRLYERALVASPTPRPRNVLPSFLQLTREGLLERARTDKDNGALFKALFDEGDATNFGGDWRAATLALLGHLAYWTGRNPSLMQDLYKESTLYQNACDHLPAWNAPHFIDGRSFGAGALDAAIQGCEEVFGTTYTLEVADLPLTFGLEANEFGNGERFAAHHQWRARYCPQRKAWMVYDIEEGRWIEGARADLEAEALAKLTARSLLLEAALTPDPARQQVLLKHANSNQNVTRLMKMLDAARTERGMRVSATDFDRDPLLLNVQNGTLDLRTGNLRPSHPDDLLSQLAPVVFAPDAQCPVFEHFISGVFDGDEDMIECIQRALGLSLTGRTDHQKFFVLQGLGSNGKSTLLETLIPLLGTYAHTIDPELLLVNDGDRKFETAHLVGKRLVVTSESEEDARLHEGRIKRWTGGEHLTGEFKFQNSFTFRPQFKLFFNTNYLPEIRGTGHGIWRRVVPISFVQTFWTEDDKKKGAPHLKADPRLLDKLRAEFPGILNWLVDGYLRYQRHGGLHLPKSVLDAKEEYQSNQDVLAPFFGDCCVFGAAHESTGGDLYDAYRSWAIAKQLAPKDILSTNKFATRLKERGLSKRHTRGGAVWTGIGVVQ